MMYNEGLKNLPISLPIQQKGQIYQEYIICISDMQKFKKHMDKKGIELLIRDVIPNHKVLGYELEHFNLPVTDYLAAHSVRLPTYPELYDHEVNKIISAIREFYT